jgi:hypothetical protein
MEQGDDRPMDPQMALPAHRQGTKEERDTSRGSPGKNDGSLMVIPGEKEAKEPPQLLKKGEEMSEAPVQSLIWLRGELEVLLKVLRVN